MLLGMLLSLCFSSRVRNGPPTPRWELVSQDFWPESGRMTWVGGIPSRTLSVSDTFGFSREVRYRGVSPDSLKLWRVCGALSLPLGRL